MARSAKKVASTQQFIEILDIVEDIIILSGGYACLIIEIEATNFELLSPQEQDAKIYAYAALLNSLSFQIQIVIRTKRLDISSYLRVLEEEKAKTKIASLSQQITLYKDFVQELVKINTVLDKKFYIVIPYSSLEKGIAGAKESLGNNTAQTNFFIGAKTNLHSKAESINTQLQRLNLKSQILSKEKAIKLFYDIFNAANINQQQPEDTIKPDALAKEGT